MIQYGFERLVLLGSAGYQRAELPLDAAVSLIAPNNTGKTSLINALQFLLIIDQRRMDFGAHDLDKSKRFYFPNNSAYILLEACLPETGTVVLGCVGKGVSYDYQYFAYKGPLDIDDYRLADGTLVAEPQLANHLASRQRLVFIYKSPNEFRDALYGSRHKRAAGEPDFTLFHLEHQSDAAAYRQVLTRTLRLDKLTSADVKKYLLEIFKRDLSDASIDFRQEWEKAFSEVNNERAQYQAAVSQSARIENLAEQVGERLVLRGQIIAWRPQVEMRLQQWQSYYESTASELIDKVQQCQVAQKQLVSRIQDLTANKLTAEQNVKQLFVLDQQQKEFECRFALYCGGRDQLEVELAIIKEQLEAQITLLGQVKSRSIGDIQRDLQQRQQRIVTLQQQKESLADNLYRHLTEQLSDEDVSRLNRGLQAGVMGLGPEHFVLDLPALKEQLKKTPIETFSLAGLQVNINQLQPQFQQLSEAELEEQIHDTQQLVINLQKQLDTAEQRNQAEALKLRLEQDHLGILKDLADFDIWQRLIADSPQRTEQQIALRETIERLQVELDLTDQQTQQLMEAQTTLRQQQAKLDAQHERIVVARNSREDLSSMFGYLPSLPHHPWLGESAWTLELLDEHLQTYQDNCQQLLKLDGILQRGLQELHAGGLTKYEHCSTQDEEWGRILDFHQMLAKEAEALEKKARSAVINVTASLKQLRNGLDAFKAQMRVFNRLVSQRQLSDLKVFKIDPRDETNLVEAIDTLMSKSAQVETGESFELFNQQSVLDDVALERAKQTLFNEGNARQGLKVADLFRLEFVIGKQDQDEESFTEIDSAASNGTVLMAKLVTGLAMLHLMQHKNKRIRTICYLDEALALDTNNQKNLIDVAAEFGFALICASPAPLTTARYCVPIYHHAGKNHINPQSWLVLTQKDVTA
ncbi:TPA: hypothetical protein P2Q89_000294 [Aeromonas veronii]|nr:hypothetical protein [Aeromonas veronii]